MEETLGTLIARREQLEGEASHCLGRFLFAFSRLEHAIFLHADPAAPGRFCDAIERSTPARASERGPHRAASDTHS